MKKLIFPSLLVIGCLSLNSFVRNDYSFAVHNQANNFFTPGAPASRTGAPGEQTCTQCHTGTANDGSTTSSISSSLITMSEYQPGVTYNMTLSINNGSSKNGFQVVALENAGNTNAGALIVTDATNTFSITGSGNTYINHTGAGTNQNSWNFDWTAPASNIGDVTLYYAYNVTDANGGNGGDQIYLGQLNLQSAGNPSSIESNREILNQSFTAAHNVSNNTIQLEFSNSSHSPLAFVKVFNIEGKCIQVDEISVSAGKNKSNIQTDFFSKGIYLVSLFLDNNVVTRKIAIN